MSTRDDPLVDTERSRPLWKSRTGLCLLVFVLTVVAVYLLASFRTLPTPDYLATATIRHPIESAEAGSGARGGPSGPDAAAVEEEILSEASLEQATRGLSLPEGGAAQDEAAQSPAERLAQVRAGLQVAATRTSMPGPMQISIACKDRNADYAAALVNRLAGQYADRHGAAARAESRRAYREAQNAAQQANQEYLQARQQFHRFLEEHFGEHESRAERLAAQPVTRGGQTSPSLPRTTQPPARSAAAGRPEPAMTDNPEWLDLDKQRADLERSRARLLLDRTPLHPEVQEVDAQLADLQQQLSRIPRQIPAEPAEPANQAGGGENALPRGAPVSQAPVPMPPSPEPWVEEPKPQWHADAAKGFAARSEALKRAEQRAEQLAQKERQAWQRQLATPPIDLGLARRAEVVEPSGRRLRLLLTALIAGVTVAAGAGMLSTGLGSGDLPFATPSEAQAMLPVPVVGVISAGAPRGGIPSTAGNSADRWIALLCGVALVAGFLGMLAVMMNTP